MDPIETIKLANGKVAKIYQDENPENPREEMDHLGKMICFHDRYTIGDKHDYKLPCEIESSKETFPVILPIYLYDHSGQTIATHPFSCHWDSGQIGFIFATREAILENFGVKKLSKKLIEQTKEILEGEIKEYDQYLTGDVYGYVIEDENGEHEDSCWGFYGLDYIREEVKAMGSPAPQN